MLNTALVMYLFCHPINTYLKINTWIEYNYELKGAVIETDKDSVSFFFNPCVCFPYRIVHQINQNAAIILLIRQLKIIN